MALLLNKTARRFLGEPFLSAMLVLARLAAAGFLGNRTLLGRSLLFLFFRDVLGVHFGLIPMQHEVGFRIVGYEGAGEAHGIVFLELAGFGLADDLHVHVRSGLGIELGVAGYKGDFERHRVR